MDWFCYWDGARQGPFSAKQVMQFAQAGRLLPTDEVGVENARVSAGAVTGLIFDITRSDVLLNVVSPPQHNGPLLLDLSPKMTVKLDGRLIGTRAIAKGFQFTVKTMPGHHTLSGAASRPRIAEKHFALELPKLAVYDILFSYTSGLRGYGSNFSYQWNVSISPADWVSEQWEIERQWWQCRFCGAEWAVAHLNQKVIHEEERYRTISEPQYQWVESPYQNPYAPTQYDRLLTGHHTTQIRITLKTYRDEWHGL